MTPIFDIYELAINRHTATLEDRTLGDVTLENGSFGYDILRRKNVQTD
jgi:hypothetical protein